MKMKFDKNYIAPAYLPQVKADMKEFKARFTDNDLLNFFNDQADACIDGDVIRADVEAYTAAGGTFFIVELVTETIIGFSRVRYFCDIDLKISTDPLLISCSEFRERN